MSGRGESRAAGEGGALNRVDRLWTAIEQRLAVWVILAEVAALVMWVSLKALASSYAVSGSIVGVLYRSIATAFILGGITHFALRRRRGAPVAVTAAVFVGLALGPVWSEAGVDWASNTVGWLQNASALALIGGPRGLVTRLTLWLALLGASLAASRGKHISVDLATRYLPAKLGGPVTMLGWVAAAVVCFAASWGFFDSIAVTKFRAEAFRPCAAEETASGGLCETAAGDRVAATLGGMRRDLFLLGRQISLDLRTLPRVLVGDPYERYMTAAAWNEWVREGGWEALYAPEAVRALLLPTNDPTQTKMPLVSEPGTGAGRDLLVRDLNFVLPFGLFMIGLRFLLRTLRMLSGELKFDPDAAHEEEDLVSAHDRAPEGVEGGAR